jgi:hypothetical protein
MTRLTHTISPFAAWARQRRPSSARVEVIFIGAMLLFQASDPPWAAVQSTTGWYTSLLR